MATLLLAFRREVDPERQHSLLAQVETWPGVQEAAPLRANAMSAAMRRFCFVRVDDDKARDVAAALRDQPEVEEAEWPPERVL